jgi:hypothetical protein
VSSLGFIRMIRCPASRRALSFGLAIAISAFSGCGYIPRPVEGVSPGAPWEALPLRKWLAEDRIEPEAMAFCAPPECRPGLVVAVIRLSGKDAEITDAILKDPERLARALRSSAGRSKPNKTIVSVDEMKEGACYGFAISLAPRDEGRAPAYGAALGRRFENGLRLVIVVGEDPDAVKSTAQEVATRELATELHR